MQALVNHPQLKMIKTSDTHWLAHDRSVKAIRCSMRPLIDTLEHIHEDTLEPETWYAEDYEDIQLCGDPDDAK